jgi:hypothetical protein
MDDEHAPVTVRTREEGLFGGRILDRITVAQSLERMRECVVAFMGSGVV